VFAVYFKDGIGLAGETLERRMQLASTARTLKGPWIMVGDWNMTPQQLAEGGVVDQTGGSVITPKDTIFTCSSGMGRMLDFVVTPRWFCGQVPVRPLGLQTNQWEVRLG
jgi:hypothetical protein